MNNTSRKTEPIHSTSTSNRKICQRYSLPSPLYRGRVKEGAYNPKKETQRMNQKQPSAILSKNGGLHSKRALKKVQELLNTHGLKRAILVHMVLTGSQSVQVYRDTYNDIADHIRDNGSRCEYFGCLEMDEDKGLHAHVYFVSETSKKFPHATLNVNDGEWLHRLADRRSLNRIHIAKPKNKIHHVNGKAQFFARLEEKDGRFADCLERIEYLYKNRSKEKVPSREIYFNSNHKANITKRVAKKATCSPIAALPAAKEEDITLESEKLISHSKVENSAVADSKQSYSESSINTPIGPLMGQPNDIKGASNESITTQGSPGRHRSEAGSSRQDRRKPSSLSKGPGSAYSSSGSPTLEQPRPRLLRSAQALSSGTTGQPIDARRQDGSSTSETGNSINVEAIMTLASEVHTLSTGKSSSANNNLKRPSRELNIYN